MSSRSKFLPESVSVSADAETVDALVQMLSRTGISPMRIAAMIDKTSSRPVVVRAAGNENGPLPKISSGTLPR